MSAIWKDIKSYEGLYQINNLGEIYSLINKKRLKISKDRYGYSKITLHKNKEMKTFRVHRLVAHHFLENKKNKKEVNHINGIKNDNRVENLEWVTPSENMQHAHKTGLVSKKFGGKKVKRVLQYTLNGILLNEFYSIVEASKTTNTDPSSISNVVNGRQYKADEFIWKYELEGGC